MIQYYNPRLAYEDRQVGKPCLNNYQYVSTHNVPRYLQRKEIT